MSRREEYLAKLRDPRWQKKRLKILERDDWKCQLCGDATKTLHVHHLWYQPGGEPWDVSDAALITFCEDCHADETEYRASAEAYLLQALHGYSWADVQELARWLGGGDPFVHLIGAKRVEYRTKVMEALWAALEVPGAMEAIPRLVREFSAGQLEATTPNDQDSGDASGGAS